jgi:hypothetical protein
MIRWPLSDTKCCRAWPAASTLTLICVAWFLTKGQRTRFATTRLAPGMPTHSRFICGEQFVFILAITDSTVPHKLLLKRVDDLNSIDFAISLHIF